MDDYIEIRNQIVESMKKVKQEYYALLVAKSENVSDTIKRERNYCYELYHQMRSNKVLMELIRDDYTFSSEINKSGHELFDDDLIPDFILHRPGKMSFENKDNLLVIEVKVVLDSNSYSGIAKDFNSLSLMVSKYEYQHGMFILINHSLDELKKKVKFICKKEEFKKINKKQKDSFSKIDIVCSKEHESIDKIISLSELLKGSD